MRQMFAHNVASGRPKNIPNKQNIHTPSLQLSTPSIARTNAVGPDTTRYTPHEVGAPRIAGSSGRTWQLNFVIVPSMPNALRSFFAVVFGYIVMIVVVIPLTLIAVKAFGVHSGHPTPGYLVYNIASTFVAAFAGGWVAGRIAPSRPVVHGIVLAVLVVFMAWLSYRRYTGLQPLWYQEMLIVAPAALAILGAWVAGRRTAN